MSIFFFFVKMVNELTYICNAIYIIFTYLLAYHIQWHP